MVCGGGGVTGPEPPPPQPAMKVPAASRAQHSCRAPYCLRGFLRLGKTKINANAKAKPALAASSRRLTPSTLAVVPVVFMKALIITLAVVAPFTVCVAEPAMH